MENIIFEIKVEDVKENYFLYRITQENNGVVLWKQYHKVSGPTTPEETEWNTIQFFETARRNEAFISCIQRYLNSKGEKNEQKRSD